MIDIFEQFYSSSFILIIFPKDFFHLISLSVYLAHQSVSLFFFCVLAKLCHLPVHTVFIMGSQPGTQQLVSLVEENTEFPPLNQTAVLKQVSC